MLLARNALLAAIIALVVVAGTQGFSQLEQPSVQRFDESPVSPGAALRLYSVESWSDGTLGNHRARVQLRAKLGTGLVAWAHVQ